MADGAGIAVGAASGAVAGSVVPGVGTVVGAVVGAASAYFGSSSAERPEKGLYKRGGKGSFKIAEWLTGQKVPKASDLRQYWEFLGLPSKPDKQTSKVIAKEWAAGLRRAVADRATASGTSVTGPGGFAAGAIGAGFGVDPGLLDARGDPVEGPPPARPLPRVRDPVNEPVLASGGKKGRAAASVGGGEVFREGGLLSGLPTWLPVVALVGGVFFLARR